MFKSRYRQHAMAQKHTDKELYGGIAIAIVIAVLGTIVVSALYWR